MENNFVGRHVIMDCVVENIFKIVSKSIVYDFLTDITDLLNMTLVVPPIVIQFPFANESIKLINQLKNENIKSPSINDFIEKIEKRNKEEAGISGVSIWAESHTAFHSWPESLYFSLDIYSCHGFNSEIAIQYVKDIFNLKYASILVVDRFIGKLATFELTEYNKI